MWAAAKGCSKGIPHQNSTILGSGLEKIIFPHTSLQSKPWGPEAANALPEAANALRANQLSRTNLGSEKWPLTLPK
jgi:hypothetical protein